jgi:hypothetical protein
MQRSRTEVFNSPEKPISIAGAQTLGRSPLWYLCYSVDSFTSKFIARGTGIEQSLRMHVLEDSKAVVQNTRSQIDVTANERAMKNARSRIYPEPRI